MCFFVLSIFTRNKDWKKSLAKIYVTLQKVIYRWRHLVRNYRKSEKCSFEGFLASLRFVKKTIISFFSSSKCKRVNHHLMLLLRIFFNISFSLNGKTFRLRSVTQYMIILTQFISKKNISDLIKFFFYFTVVSRSSMFLKTNQHADIKINTGTTRQNW